MFILQVTFDERLRQMMPGGGSGSYGGGSNSTVADIESRLTQMLPQGVSNPAGGRKGKFKAQVNPRDTFSWQTPFDILNPAGYLAYMGFLTSGYTGGRIGQAFNWITSEAIAKRGWFFQAGAAASNAEKMTPLFTTLKWISKIFIPLNIFFGLKALGDVNLDRNEAEGEENGRSYAEIDLERQYKEEGKTIDDAARQEIAIKARDLQKRRKEQHEMNRNFTWTGAGIGALHGAIKGALYGTACGGFIGFILGLLGGTILGGLTGASLGNSLCCLLRGSGIGSGERRVA